MPIMGSSKIPSEEYVKRSARERAGVWRWWFIVLLLAGLVAAVLVFSTEFSSKVKTTSDASVASPMFALAFVGPAAVTTPQTATTTSEESRNPPRQPEKKNTNADIKPFVMVGILSLLGLITVLSLIVSLFSKNEKSVALASDLLKTCLGFFIGVATSYFGAS